ncbi:hypothetical protein CEP54_001333 [Fusarium duplospermum]|uniref:Uncharacterized protein n=1 Tax=Fusarium duplospermum TaxID=1325734 RepID=A0A428R1F8_9HYPO|nr:hypothetical protein CEP54_001333 [Fusarium duplospermum]
MRSFLKEDMCGLRSWKGEASNIDPGVIGSYMPEEVEYACLHWTFHVEEAKGTSLADGVLAFLNDHFLHWAEALALMMRTVEAITAMQRILGISRPQENTRLSDFLVDAVQILKANQAILDKAPLQLYSSILQSSPQNSVVKKQFIRVLPRWMTLRPRTESNWSPLKQVLECEARITCVALSHDSRLVAAYLANGFIHIWRIDTDDGRLLAFYVFQVREERFGAVIQCYSDLGDLIWESMVMESLKEWASEEETILDVSVAFSGDLTMIAARMDHTLTVWRINPYYPEKVFGSFNPEKAFESFNPDESISIALSHDGALLFMTSRDGFRVWSIDSTDHSSPRFRDVGGYGWFSGSLTVSADSTFMACGGDDYVYLWHKEKGEGIQNVVRQRSAIAVLSRDSSIIISGSGDKCLYVWSKNTFEPNQRRLVDDSCEVDIHPTLAQMMELSPNSELIAFALLYGSQIQLWTSDTGRHIRTLIASQGRLDQFAFSRNSDLLAARSLPSGDIWLAQ